ncbi:hypothetical protein TcasGA2_TC005213 [Tribolium castaneum]|uniref:Endonuclease/exonuclease/phosphatase domain-containing protein n=1 Tax=Tribolium castaneum TaxID=7070 RepID=D6X1J6_TRICA|nr:hypothetical protein TcasGA2_TC005213 [Tribolium castaneum]
MCFSEHWLNTSECESISLENFSPKSWFTRGDKGYGGSIIFTRNNLQCVALDQLVNLSVTSVREISAIKLVLTNAIVISIYRPPSGDFELFLTVINSLLKHLDFSKKNILGVDFNVKFNSPDLKCHALIDLLLSYDLQPLVNFNIRGPHCLNNIFSNTDINLCKVSPFRLCLSDHIDVRFRYHNNFIQEKAITKIVRPITQIGKIEFFKSLESVQWDYVIDNCDLQVEESFQNFIDVIEFYHTLHFPEKMVKTLVSKSITWFDSELKQIRHKLFFLNDLYSITKSDNVKAARFSYRTAIKIAKIKANDNFIKSSKNTSGAMWTVINPKRRRNINCDMSDCDITANDFNVYFTNVAKTVIDKVTKSDCDPIVFTRSVPELNRVRTKHVTGNEVIVGAVIQPFEENPISSVRNISKVLNVQVSRIFQLLFSLFVLFERIKASSTKTKLPHSIPVRRDLAKREYCDPQRIKVKCEHALSDSNGWSIISTGENQR